MRRAMLMKEFRELAAWAGVLLAVMILATINLAGLNPFTLQKLQYEIPIPFVNSEGTSGLMLYGSVSAMVLAFRQTVGESVQGTWLLLLHRPVPRGWLVSMKILIGLCVLLVITGIPLFSYTIWAATPGTHASPFRWAFIIPAVLTWLQLSIVYLAAFLCGVRDAHWLGSRLLPMIPALVAYSWVSAINSVHVWLAPIAMTMGLNLLLLSAIYYVVDTREFTS